MKETNFEVGDILNFSWSGFIGTSIKIHNYLLYGYSKENKWTHTAIVSDIKVGGIIEVCEAQAQGVVFNTYSKEELQTYINNGNLIVGRAKMVLTNVREICLKYVGLPYGYLDIFNIILHTIFRDMIFTIPTGAKQVICSEAVARILYDSSDKKIDFEKEFKKRYDRISPIDLYHSKQIKWDKKQPKLI